MSDTNIPQNALLFLEDFVVTQLLRKGKSLKGTELSSAAEGFHLSRGALHEALQDNPLVTLEDREWNLRTRLEKQHLSKEERDRQPMEGVGRRITGGLVRKRPANRIQISVSVTRVRLEMGTLRPFVPGIDENKAPIRR